MYLVLLCSASFGLTPLVVEEVASGSVRRRVVVDGERTSTYVAPRWGGAVRSTFVPTGTVAQEYVKYQFYHVAQDLSTQLRATLATTAVFSGLGLGASKTMGAAAATLVFLSRDASGMATSLIAASRLAPKLGGDARRFRFAGDVAVDIALLCELLSPRKFFIVLLCVASVLKALCGVLAGGANAAISAYFARSAGAFDVAQVTAKSNAVSTLSGIVGLTLSLAVTALGLTKRFALIPYTVLTAVHLITCARGLQLLELTGVGCSRRFALVHDSWIITGVAPTPSDLAKLDSVVGWPQWTPSLRRRGLVVSSSRILQHRLMTKPDHIFDAYVLARDSSKVVLAMRTGATPADERRALCHALALIDAPTSQRVGTLRPSDVTSASFDASLLDAGFDLDDPIFPADAPTLRFL